MPDRIPHTVRPTAVKDVLIAHEIVTRTWTPAKGSNGATFQPNTAILNKVGDLSGSRIDATETGDYILKGDSESQLQKAASKLQVLSNAMVRPIYLI